MKTRKDFVSNSSSSSFIVITDTGEKAEAVYGKYTLPDCENGETKYGWQTRKYSGVFDKLNWCAIIIRDKRRMEKNADADTKLRENVKSPWFGAAEMEKLLKKVCTKAGFNVSVAKGFAGDFFDENGYIDHQSAVYECFDNARMFRTEKELEDFLFNRGSYIDCSNDNGGRDDDEYDYTARKYTSQPPDYYDVKTWRRPERREDPEQ